MHKHKMRSALRHTFLAFALGLPTLVYAQASAPSNSCPPAPMPMDQQMAYVNDSPARNAGFMWRIEKDARTSWLYGTMHLNHIDFAKPGPEVMRGMRSSDLLAVELNPYEVQTPPISSPSPTLKLSTAQLERLRKAYTRDCIALSPENIQPAGVKGPILIAQAQRQALLAGYSPDSRLAQIAKRSGKPIVQLETLAQQMSALAPRSQSEFDVGLDLFLNDVESGKAQSDLLQLNLAWRQSEWSTFEQLEQTMSSSQPEFAHRLLDERNVQMAQKIDALHSEGRRVFVAVGVLHMAGKTALPKLMQDKGYTVTRMPLKN